MFKKILFFIFIIQFTYSQDRQLIQGKVIYRNIDVPAANVINNTGQSSTITNDQGEFEIFAKFKILTKCFRDFPTVQQLSRSFHGAFRDMSTHDISIFQGTLTFRYFK